MNLRRPMGRAVRHPAPTREICKKQLLLTFGMGAASSRWFIRQSGGLVCVLCCLAQRDGIADLNHSITAMHQILPKNHPQGLFAKGAQCC